MKLRHDSFERRSKVFRLYLKAKRKSDYHLNERPQGRSAIGVSEDYDAKEWQSVQMRISIMEAYLLSENAPNWFNARWLSYEEAKRRNDSYWN